VKRPQRDVIGDRDLVDGIVGLAAIAERMRALVVELAEDAESAEEIDSELVDAMLGLYALAAAVVVRDPEPVHDEVAAADPEKDLLR